LVIKKLVITRPSAGQRSRRNTGKVQEEARHHEEIRGEFYFGDHDGPHKTARRKTEWQLA
jgi:hypothetical protein